MSTTLLDSNVILGGEIAAAAASGEARASIILIATDIIVTAAHSTSIQVR
jgi:V8-like Glu-specific endopeptidase